jgi:ribosomal protein S12 methylthiotransferase accessory factor YcaO
MLALPGGREKAKIGITVSSCLITQWHRIPCIEAHLTDTDKSFYIL